MPSLITMVIFMSPLVNAMPTNNSSGLTPEARAQMRREGYTQSEIDSMDMSVRFYQNTQHLRQRPVKPSYNNNDWHPSHEEMMREHRQLQLQEQQQREKDARIVRERLAAARTADQQRRLKQLPNAVENWRQGMERGISSGLAPHKEFARKEREIGRPLNQSEKNYYLQYGGYPASQQQRLRNMSWDDLSKQENSPSYVERRRRVNEARNRTPLENAIRRWFTPVKNQIPEKYLK
jgi:hypothetical protein